MLILSVLFGKTRKRLDPTVATLLNLEVTSAVNQIPYATATFTLASDILHNKMLEAFNATTGQCEVGTEVQIKHLEIPLFNGVVTQQTVQVKNGKALIVLKLRHKLFTLQTLARSQVFINKTDAAIFSQLLTTDGVHVGETKGLNISHEQMVQLNCTDWQFVRARLKANDVWVLAHPDKIDIVEPKVAAVKADHKLTPKGASMLLLSAQWQNHHPTLPGGVEIHSWDLDKQALNTTQAKTAAIGSGGFNPAKFKAASHKPWSISYTMPLPPKEQTALTNAIMQAESATGIQTRFEIEGSAAFSLGDTLELAGFGSHLDGKGIISGIVHHAVSGKWTTEIHTGIEPGLGDDGSFALVPKAEGLFVGIVAEMKEDKQFRIQVQIPALGKESHPLWARFSQPYASKDSGMCFYPEKDDEVVVSFFEGDPRYPVILGAMHNAKNKPPFAHSKDNAQRGWVFVHEKEKQSLLFNRKTSQIELVNHAEETGKHQSLLLDAKEMQVHLQNNVAEAEKKQSLLFDAPKMQVHLQNNVADAEKKQSLLFNADEMKIVVDNNLDNAEKKQTLSLDAKEMKVDLDNVKEKLLLHSGVALSSETDSITLKAKKDITLEAAVALALKGENATLEAVKALTLKAVDASIAGTKSVKQSAGEIELAANEKMVLNSSAQLTASSAKVEINGQASIAIKAVKVDIGP